MPRVPGLPLSSLSLLSLLMVWTLPGFLAGNRIRFGRQEYVFTEGQSSPCLDIVLVGAPATSDFSVTFTIDTVLLGVHGGVTRDGSGSFPAGQRSSSAVICIKVSDNEDVCEMDVVGIVRLINTSSLEVDEPSIATVRVKDDDTISLNFSKESQEFTEGSGRRDIPVTLGTEVQCPITVQVTGVVAAGNMSAVIPNAGAPLDSVLTFEPTVQETSVSLDITDDTVALEDPEEIVLSLSVLSSKCKITSPIGQMQVTILDDDEVIIELKEEHISVIEHEGAVDVCVIISSEIAKPLPFTITTQDQSATGGLDYTGVTITEEFVAFSQTRELCLTIPILQDSLVEDSETFSVSLAVDSYPELRNERLKVRNTKTQVTIKDSSYCFAINITGNEVQYTPPLTTMCFMCTCEANGLVSWTVQGKEVGPESGKVLLNGTLLIPNSSQAFRTNMPTLISCAVQERCNHTFPVLLGEPASVLNLVYTIKPVTDKEQLVLTCSFGGTPAPDVQWSFRGASFKLSDPNFKIETTNNGQSVLRVFNITKNNFGRYTCEVTNEFGSSNEMIIVDDPKAAGVGSGSHRTLRSWLVTLALLVLCVLCL